MEQKCILLTKSKVFPSNVSAYNSFLTSQYPNCDLCCVNLVGCRANFYLGSEFSGFFSRFQNSEYSRTHFYGFNRFFVLQLARKTFDLIKRLFFCSILWLVFNFDLSYKPPLKIIPPLPPHGKLPKVSRVPCIKFYAKQLKTIFFSILHRFGGK